MIKCATIVEGAENEAILKWETVFLWNINAIMYLFVMFPPKAESAGI